MGGGGFLSSALTTAAGVAGGLVAGNLLASAFGLGSHAQAGTPSDTAAPASTPQADTVSAADNADDSPQVQDASYDEADDDDDDDAGYDGGDTSDWL